MTAGRKAEVYTPESLLRLSSLAESPAAHLRAWVSPAIGFPLHPLIYWRVPVPQIEEIRDILWWTPAPDGPRELQPPIDLDGIDGPVFAELRDAGGSDFAARWCWVAVDVADPHVPLTVAVADGGAGTRTLLQRSAWPYTLGASRITRLRITGHGQVVGVRGVDATTFTAERALVGLVSALPVPDSRWYTGGISPDEALDRAAQAGPTRTGPLDRGVDVQLGYDDEFTRVRALTGIDRTGPHALLQAAHLHGDLPARHRTQVDLPDDRRPAQARFATVEALLTGAADPGVARWLGLLATDRVDEDLDPERPYAWVSAGYWALDPDRPVTKAPRTALGDVLATMADPYSYPPWTSQWTRLVRAAFPDVARVLAELPGHVVVQPMVAPVGLGAVSDPPATPDPVLAGPATWEDRDHYGRRLRLRGPTSGAVAFARGSLGLNERILTGGPGLDERGLILLPGRADGPGGTEGALADTGIPADEPVTWLVATADEFGRWSEDGRVSAEPPDRPELPAPVVEAAFVPATELPPTGSVVPGTVSVQVAVPTALGPGTLPVTDVEVVVHGRPPDHVAPAELVAASYDAPETGVGGTVRVPVTVRFHDERGPGPATSTTVSVRDPRRPAPLVVGPAVLWAARPDPTGTAELALRLPAQQAGWTYHVYLAEETALRRTLGLPLDRDRNRAQRAKEIADAAGRIGDRSPFTLAATVTGVRFATALPGAVRTLRFVRAVPVTPAGREADFAACPLVPVAVPGPDRPPSPALTVAANGPDLRLVLTVHGIDRRTLDRLHPGAPPRYRLRRATAGTGDPLYVPVTDTGELAPAADGAWTAVVPARGLAPFVRYTWQAEACLPPEIALAAAPRPSTVLPERGEPGDPAPSPWSTPSVPVQGMVTAPIPPLDARATLPGPTLTLRAAPVAAPDAVGAWRLRVWRRGADGALTPLDPPNGDGWAVTSSDLTLTDPGWAGEAYALQLVDPLGRTGPLTEVPSPLVRTTTALLVEEALTASGVDGAWLTGIVTADSPAATDTTPTGTVRFRTGDGIVLGEAPPRTALHVGFGQIPFWGGRAAADYLGDAFHAPSTSDARPLPEGPELGQPPDIER
ncbi:hypothetical protein [Pseudonocardia cypriaca]|uniref:Uncharacterized protein n=1 Tax=Pseudonocardia cypriaca TaxID=882449 RepID=A0A543FTD9_9PSEU|nr:hypothetical protein [Pseudonocardia cypriaca]TQM37014.1 hypothetical protein FB388_4213 [Pseudonocardia cypriaca]